MKGEIIRCDDGRIVQDLGHVISVFIPMEIRRRSGRKEIIMPNTLPDDAEPTPLVVALARAYAWQKYIDEGEFSDAQALALHLGVDPSLVRRTLRLGVLSPRIVEAALDAKEPEVSLQALLEMVLPVEWEEQEVLLFAEHAEKTSL